MAGRRAVEICAGDGLQSNTANLIINHGWKALLFDGDSAKIEAGRKVYAQLADTFTSPPRMVDAWITRDNVNSLVQEHGFAGAIDLLSLDVDGVDYWIWDALECIQPRVVVLEYNAAWGPGRAVTVPYDPAFRLDFSRQPYYCGASLAAFVKLGKKKGYRLAGSNRAGFNAFFVRSEISPDILPEVTAASCLENWIDFDWGDRLWLDV